MLLLLVREPPRGDLDHGDAEGPDVGADIVVRRVPRWVDALGLNIELISGR